VPTKLRFQIHQRATPRSPLAADVATVRRALDLHFAGFGQTKLQMPMPVLGGEKASGEFLIQQGRMVADNVEGVLVKGSGHWLIGEAPRQVIAKLVEFLGR
jgi:pimeloyl-ACP methyl ester carboxylesterase